jgi:hypothetical protein
VSDLEDLQGQMAEIRAKMAEMTPDAILARVREMSTPETARILSAPPTAPAPSSSSSSSPAPASGAPADYSPWERDPSPSEFAAMSQAEMQVVDRIRSLVASGQSSLDERIEATMRWDALREEHNARREAAAAAAACEAEIEASPELQMQRVVQRQVGDYQAQLGSLSEREAFLRGSGLGVFSRTADQLREQGFSPSDVARITAVGRRVVEIDPARYGIAGTVQRGDGRHYTVVPFGQDLDEVVGRYGVMPGESSGEGGNGGE